MITHPNSVTYANYVTSHGSFDNKLVSSPHRYLPILIDIRPCIILLKHVKEYRKKLHSTLCIQIDCKVTIFFVNLSYQIKCAFRLQLIMQAFFPNMTTYVCGKPSMRACGHFVSIK